MVENNRKNPHKNSSGEPKYLAGRLTAGVGNESISEKIDFGENREVRKKRYVRRRSGKPMGKDFDGG